MNARLPDGPRSSRRKEALIFARKIVSLLTSAATRSSTIAVSLLIAYAGLGIEALRAAAEQHFGIDHRLPWTSSRVVGSPDPPLPYTVEKTFTNTSLRAPIFITPEPDTDSLLVVQQGGEKERPSKILRLRDDPKKDQVEPFLEVSNRLVYSVAFHPGYRTNGFLFVFSNGTTSEPERTNGISRFTV